MSKLQKEMFGKTFTVYDVKSVCTVGQLIPDTVVYRFGQHFSRKSDKKKPVFVENPSFIASILDLGTLQVNEAGNASPHPLPITYSQATHHLPTSYPSPTHHLPTSYPSPAHKLPITYPLLTHTQWYRISSVHVSEPHQRIQSHLGGETPTGR